MATFIEDKLAQLNREIYNKTHIALIAQILGAAESLMVDQQKGIVN